jgi:CRP-like cAMP-binding protein
MQLEQTTALAQESIQYNAEAIASDFREYLDGETIITEGERGNEVFRLYSSEGGLEVLKNGRRIAVINEPGEYFGEMSFLLNEPRTATVRSIGKSVVEVIAVHENDLESLIFNDPEMAHRLVVTLAQRLKQANLLAAG